MTIQLTPAQAQLIHNKLQTGQYQSVEEILEIAFRLLEEYESEDAAWLEIVRAKINAAYETTAPPIDGSTFITQLRQRFRPNQPQ